MIGRKAVTFQPGGVYGREVIRMSEARQKEANSIRDELVEDKVKGGGGTRPVFDGKPVYDGGAGGINE